MASITIRFPIFVLVMISALSMDRGLASPEGEPLSSLLKPLIPSIKPGLNDGGIGLYIVIDDIHDVPRAYAIVDGGPAQRAGIVADPNHGDLITAINGVSTHGKPRDTVIMQIRGQVGSTVFLTIERSGAAAPIVTPIVRDLLAPLLSRNPAAAPAPPFQRVPPKTIPAKGKKNP